jgi:undecaprenyl-diphosphatase
MKMMTSPNISTGGMLRQAYLAYFLAVIILLAGCVVTLLLLYPAVWLTPLNALDHLSMVALNFDGGAVADRFFFRYSHQQWWLPLAAVTLLYTLGWQHQSWRNWLGFILILALMLTFSDQLTSGVIKPLVGRLRPSHDLLIASQLHYVGDYRGGRFGFVSGHAANICCLCTLLAYIYRSRVMRAVLLLFAITMCYSRIYLGVHFPGDILCGAAVGMAIAGLTIRLTPKDMLPRYTRVPWGIVGVWGATTAVMFIEF